MFYRILPVVSPMLIFILLLTTATGVAIADTSTDVFSHPVDATNEAAFMKEVQRLQLKNQQVKGFTQQKHISALKRPLISTGTIVLDKRGICLATTTPFSSAVKITRDGIWQQSENRKATVKSADEHFEIRHTANILIALFTADKKILQERFYLHYQNQNGQFTIGLRPKDRILAKIISHIIIEGSTEIRRIAIQEANGDNTAISISDEPPLKQISLETCIH